MLRCRRECRAEVPGRSHAPHFLRLLCSLCLRAPPLPLPSSSRPRPGAPCTSLRGHACSRFASQLYVGHRSLGQQLSRKRERTAQRRAVSKFRLPRLSEENPNDQSFGRPPAPSLLDQDIVESCPAADPRSGEFRAHKNIALARRVLCRPSRRIPKKARIVGQLGRSTRPQHRLRSTQGRSPSRCSRRCGVFTCRGRP